MKQRVKELGLRDIRVNNSGCLERCEFGPALVIYPEGIWYHYENKQDVDEILIRHLIQGEKVKRLILKDGQKYPESVKFLHLNLVVKEINRSESNVLTIELTDTSGSELPCFIAGANITLLIESLNDSRTFALVNSPEERHRYVISVPKTDNNKKIFNWLRTELQVDDVIRSSFPSNTTELDDLHSSPEDVQPSWKNHGFKVVIARQQKIISVAANENILDMLRKKRLTTMVSCNNGKCGCCRVRVLHGQVEHRDSVLSEKDRTVHNTMLVCMSRAAISENQLILDI